MKQFLTASLLILPIIIGCRSYQPSATETKVAFQEPQEPLKVKVSSDQTEDHILRLESIKKSQFGYYAIVKKWEEKRKANHLFHKVYGFHSEYEFVLNCLDIQTSKIKLQTTFLNTVKAEYLLNERNCNKAGKALSALLAKKKPHQMVEIILNSKSKFVSARLAQAQ